MSNANDLKIMTLKQQIENKRSELNSIGKFTPVTNCSLEFKGERYNLHTLNKDKIMNIMVELTIYELAVEKLGLLDEYLISGYKIADWVVDLKQKLAIVTQKEEERKLKVMEDKLTQLLSEDKKTELEIDSIASELNL